MCLLSGRVTREESSDEIWRGERRIKRGQLEREKRKWPERGESGC